jgi:hypothetical protein
MRTTHRITGGTLALMVAAGMSAIPVAVHADRNSDRNAGIALGVTAAVLLATQRNKTAGLIVAAGAAYELARGSRGERVCIVCGPGRRDHRWERRCEWCHRDVRCDRREDRERDWRRDDDRYRRGERHDGARVPRWNHEERARR